MICPEKKLPVPDLHPEKEQDKAKGNDICSYDRKRVDPDPVRCPQEHPGSKEQEHCKREVLGFPEFPGSEYLRDKGDGCEGPCDITGENDGVHEISPE